MSTLQRKYLNLVQTTSILLAITIIALLAVAGNNAYVAWCDNTPGNADILLRKSDNTGVTFGSTINVSQNAGFSVSNENTAVIRNKVR